MNRTTKVKAIRQALQKYSVIHGVKSSGHVDHDKKDSLPVIDSSQKRVLHCQEDSFRAMRTTIGRLKRFSKVVGVHVSVNLRRHHPFY